MTINIDSLWVLLGIGMALGAGGYIGVCYAALSFRAGKASGAWLADKVIWPLYLRVSAWRTQWKK